MIQSTLRFILFTSLIIPFWSFSQEYDHAKCGTDFYHQEYFNNNPQAYEDFIQHLNSRDLSPFKAQRRADLRIIPVVVHIIHQGGTENITNEQVHSLIHKVNDDFQGKNEDSMYIRELFKPLYANLNIEFRLAKIDPDGKCTDGINRVYSGLTINARDNVKSLIRWNNKKYLNIWIVRSIYNYGQSGIILGFATFPTNSISNPSKDGIVIRSDYHMYGGRTLTHEIGHYLGLFHTFQGSCGGNCETSGDRVCDTPPVDDDSYGCDPNKNSCHNDSPDLPDMNENHMDYTSCRLMFTKGQKEVVDFYLASAYRNTLTTSSNLVATGVNSSASYSCIPVADFQVVDNTHCINSGVEFLDQSHGSSDINYKWYFEGGTPYFTNVQNPVVQYSVAGKYNAKLVVSTTTGKDSIVKSEVVMIYPDKANDIAYKENFEDPAYADDYWYIQEEKNNVGWKRTNISSIEGNHSFYLNNFYSTLENVEYFFITPPVDLRNTTSPAMHFKYAHAQKNEESKDILRVYVSKNCGENWSLRTIINQVNLPTSGQYVSTQFIPQSNSQWRDFVLDLNNYVGESHVLVKVALFSIGGNNLYIDDLKFYSTTSLNDQINLDDAVKVYPVPASHAIFIETQSNFKKKVNLYISDILGNFVYEEKQIELNSSSPVKFDLSNINVNKSGIYFMYLESDNQLIRKKFIVIR